MTTDNALLLAESTDPYRTKEPHHRKYHQWNKSRGRMGGQIRMRSRYKAFATPWFDYLLVSRGEMRDLVEGTGWMIRRFFDSPQASYFAMLGVSTCPSALIYVGDFFLGLARSQDTQPPPAPSALARTGLVLAGGVLSETAGVDPLVAVG